MTDHEWGLYGRRPKETYPEKQARVISESQREAIIKMRQAEPAEPLKNEWVRDVSDLVIQVVVVALILGAIVGMCAIAVMSYYSGPAQ
jgi:hypothetical protein